MNNNSAKQRNTTGTNKHITTAHLSEWVKGSGVPEEITRRSLQSLNDRTVIASRLGWKKYSDKYPLGWWVSGLDLATMEPQTFGQFKPDEEISLNPEDPDDTAKYISAKGEYDAIALLHPDKDYWQCIVNDPSIPIYPIEGPKKAGALIGLGYCAPALCGVTMGLKPGGKQLVKNLEILAAPGRPVYLPWDADLATNPNVRKALIAFATVLKQRGCIVFVVVIPPELECKAIDDVLVTHGPERVKKIMSSAVPYSQWLKNLEGQLNQSGTRINGKKSKELPPPSVIAAEIAEIYRDKLAWESEYQLWRRYSAKYDGVWSVETVESIKGLIQTHLRSQPLPGFNAGYVSSIATILQSDLEVLDWDEQADLIPLQDGVLDQVTQELKPHAPGYRFTWQLPFKWRDRSVGCQPIEEFLLKITGNQSIADVLLAYLAAIVTRRSDLQRYLELKGGGGTGKSTFMALARALAGDENTVSSQLKHLENNQFETAKFYRKLLVLLPDSERWQGEVSVLKQLTGQDPIRYERKGVQQCRDFVFGGMVILSANEAPESRDLTSGQERRKLTVELDIKIPEYEDKELAKQFKPFLPGLLKRVLDIPASEVTRLIKHTDREVPALAQVKWKQLCSTNPIAGWLEEKAVLDPEAKGYVGLGDIEQAGRWLYANFCKYQQENGAKTTVPMKRFSINLRDLLKNQMKVNISEGRDHNGSYIGGLGLRCQLDPTGNRYPCPVTKKPFCDGFVTDGDGLVTAESHALVGFDGFDGFFQNSNDNEKNVDSSPLPTKFCGVDGEQKPENLSNPTRVSIPTVTNPSSNQHKSITQPKTPRVFEVGDRVVVKDLGGQFHGVRGEIIKITPTPIKTELLVRFDKAVALTREQTFIAGDLMKL